MGKYSVHESILFLKIYLDKKNNSLFLYLFISYFKKNNRNFFNSFEINIYREYYLSSCVPQESRQILDGKIKSKGRLPCLKRRRRRERGSGRLEGGVNLAADLI